MACYFFENILTTSFTPKEFQVELLDISRNANTIVCLNSSSDKTFVALKLLQELSLPVRRPWSCGGKRSLFIGSKVSVHYYAQLINHLTDLTVGEYVTETENIDFNKFQVLSVSADVCAHWVSSGKIPWDSINLIILEDCHNALKQHPIREIILSLKSWNCSPRLLGLTSPLFTCSKVQPGAVEAQLNKLEEDLSSKVESANDIVSILRYNVRPRELLLECDNYTPGDLSGVLEAEIRDLQNYLFDHRFDPTEIYEDSFHEELKSIPDPKKEPLQIVEDFLEVLNTMGPWCADRAAHCLVMHIEKLKVKTPYERHFLLLCSTFTKLIKIRAICESYFKELSEAEQIYRYSSPKVRRLIEVLRQFKPSKPLDNENTPEIVESPTTNNVLSICDNVEKTNGLVCNESSTDLSSMELVNNTSNGIEEEENENSCAKPNHEITENRPMIYQNGDLTSGDAVVYENNIKSQETDADNKNSLGHVLTYGELLANKTTRSRGRGGRGWRNKKGGGGPNQGRIRHQFTDDPDSLCGIIFVEKRFTAKILYQLFNELHKYDPDFVYILTQYTVGKQADPIFDPREAEIEHKRQEEVLKRFRMRECNLVIATSVLEDGMELPKCNLIVRYDPVSSYKSHAYSKGRAKQSISFYISLVEKDKMDKFLSKYAQYICTEELLLKRSINREAPENEIQDADMFTHCVPAYKPTEDGPFVDMSSSIALVNRYCAKLPSDTFTRLTPLWSMHKILFNGESMYYCKVRLPINSPVKQTILGHPMPTRALAQRVAALETCHILHTRGELDDRLEPIGKEAYNTGYDDEDMLVYPWDPSLPRPGTTKSRQYYYKRIANCLNDCRPVAGVKCYLYNIDMKLTCPLPEEQNTRGRKLYPPELAPQAFGILTTKEISKVCPFPIFTRSGEVEVSLKLSSTCVVLSERNVTTIAAFLNFIFTSVLRLQRYIMSFDPGATENSFFIVPTRRNTEGISEIDWDFLEVIYERKDETPHLISDEERKNFQFNYEQYTDAVVMPWYRNQDQPQYFYVAEICTQLSPKSGFPGCYYKTFEDYYLKKYDIQIQNTSQPLLDVDHTSARLNFLTPRYVNRKGVALPTSSEETKRAKRENLEQKQILVGELCMIHVVPASLWRQAVCLPCILYRLNALLLADEIRTRVAKEIGLGLVNLPQDFEWSSLDFGWSLADVLKKSKQESEKKAIEEPEPVKEDVNNDEEPLELITNGNKLEAEVYNVKNDSPGGKSDKDSDDLSVEEKCDELTDEEGNKDDWMEIGTWSNDMAQLNDDLERDLPPELSMVRYGSPTSWDVGENQSFDYSSDCDSDDSEAGFLESESSTSSGETRTGRLKITFRNDYLAEAVEDEVDEKKKSEDVHNEKSETWAWESDGLIPQVKEDIEKEVIKFENCTKERIETIKNRDMVVRADQPFSVDRECAKNDSKPLKDVPKKDLTFSVNGYGMPFGVVPPESPLNHTENNALDVKEFELNDEDITFSFDAQPDLEGHPGPSPSILLQALTMSNANDGINLERLETIGDSFLKYAITTYLYCTHENIHEGKLSHLRSKQVSNYKLYRLGQKKVFGESMIATKFEPHDNWLPPCYLIPRESEQELLDTVQMSTLPYNLVTQHSIPDKSIADCVEALIGAYLIECGPRGALIFMSWLGIKVVPREEVHLSKVPPDRPRPVGSFVVDDIKEIRFTELSPPESPLLRHVPDPEGELALLLAGFESLEESLQYSFRDKSYLLQAMSHASYSPNRITDCYQRLEFLGDAVLDYLITRHLYEDKRAHSPGALTDLRSALVNNTIFASLAVKHGLHKYFRHLSPGLAEVVQSFVTIQEENSHNINEEYYLVGEEAEDVEVPKALGDVFESIAGAIFLDSGMSLDTVWKVYYRMMKKEIEQFSTKVPKSPIRELLELEPETAKFGKPEKLADGRRVRVTVEIFGKGTFKGIGRNYRIAKCTAAKCALKQLKIGLLAKKLSEPSPSFFKVLRAYHDIKIKY